MTDEPKHARDMSVEEYLLAKRRLIADAARQQARTAGEHALADARRRHPDLAARADAATHATLTKG